METHGDRKRGDKKRGKHGEYKNSEETNPEDTFQTHDGKWFSRRVTPYKNKKGESHGIVITFVDITMRKRWEETLQDRESYLRQVIDNIGGVVAILDVDGTLKDVNETASIAGGVSRDEVIGQPFWECYWWTHDQATADQLQEAVKTAASGKQVRYDVEVRMANDGRKMIDFMIAPVIDKDGKVTALIPSGVDISERVVAQKQAIRGQQQLNLATEVGRLGSWTWDLPSNSISWSEKLHTLYGYNREQFDGTPEAFLEIVVPEDRHIVKAAIDAVLHQKTELIDYECRSVRKSDGQKIWTHVRGVTERDPEGNTIRATGIAVDITTRKQRELSLAFLAGLQVELADLSNVDEIISLATKRIANFLELTHCILVDTDIKIESADVFHDHHIDGAPDLCGMYDLKDFWSDEDRTALANGQLLSINDTSDPSQPKNFRERFGALGIRAIINSPCIRNQKAAFILCATKSTAYQWQPHEKELLRELATSLYLRIERARAESELIESKKQLQLGIEVASLSLGHVDYVNDLVTLSAEAALLYGLGNEPVSITRDEIHATFHPDDREELDDCIMDSLNPDGDGRISVEHRVVGIDGSTGWLNVRKQVFFDQSVDPPRPSHAILVAQDITQRKEAESSLKEARAMAEMASNSKSEFLANMSHEIRTPMSAILGYADILNRHLKDPDNRNCVSIIRSNGQFLLGIINDILDISKIEAGKLELSRSDFRVDQLVGDVESLMSVRATEKKIDLTVRYEGKIPKTIHSDDKRIKQVLINLVGNAIKFTETGDVTLSVGLEKKPTKSLLKFDVIDTGIGVSAEQAKKLFQPFTQADNSVDRKFGGTGLGLTISQRLARMLDGDITFESEFGKGSTFSLAIDLGDLEDAKLIHPKPSVPAVDTIDPSKTAKLGSPLSGRFLVVDDRREIRFIAQHFVEEAGGEVMTAANGQEAIDIVTAESENNATFDAIVMDMQMPVMDGYEAARRLRTFGFEQPIIALTAHAMDGDRDRCIEAGCTNYISKPLDGPKFVNMLASYVQGSK